MSKSPYSRPNKVYIRSYLFVNIVASSAYIVGNKEFHFKYCTNAKLHFIYVGHKPRCFRFAVRWEGETFHLRSLKRWTRNRRARTTSPPPSSTRTWRGSLTTSIACTVNISDCFILHLRTSSLISSIPSHGKIGAFLHKIIIQLHMQLKLFTMTTLEIPKL
jgi:hypothetical protein